MSKSKIRVPKYPVVNAYSPGPAILKDRPHLSKSWIVPCPYCGNHHVHGAMAGPRNAHCPRGPDWLTEGWERPYGYTLKLSGEIDDPNIFRDDARRAKAKYAAYLKVFEDRSKARVRESRAAFRPISKRSAKDRSRAVSA